MDELKNMFNFYVGTIDQDEKQMLKAVEDFIQESFFITVYYQVGELK